MSRQTILNAIKNNKPPLVACPDLNFEICDSDSMIEKFQKMVKTAGANCIALNSIEEAKIHLDALINELDANTVYSQIQNIEINTVDHNTIQSPHNLQSVDLVVINGGTAVAENGAIWVTDEEIKYRAAWFITQHLAIIVKKQNIVSNMLEAYQNIKIKRPGFGCFISGPSKTADIEQSLVIGAHGARSLTVFLI